MLLAKGLPLPGPRRRLRAWRRTRPFWGGLLVLLGGTELLLVPLSPLTVLVSLGLGGVAAIGIGAALVVAALFLWFLPRTRAYVSVHALLLSVLSFVATNLGGFLVGMLLGVAGSAPAFGWTPRPEGGGDRGGAARLGRGAPRVLAAALPVALPASLTTGATATPARAAAPVTVARTSPTVTTSLFAPQGIALAGVTEVARPTGPARCWC
ncbi:hypothetical protein GCM10010347_56700 [Streptomyces cirratus]|uniref:Uncharacterized protein n=1 Tax=Streptomyces cirratus TaxID=68187 RepID=A0ABQ3F089_9ACTN|nr:DUF6114 domain-containing protein [Streptomyces cirratus]GHB78891.1 hypothetical protein GCM10010347_56700 [Streptomyces cirratus]